MKYFSMPCDFKKETADEYYELNKKYTDSRIIEVYGQITFGEGVGFSARFKEELNVINFDILKEYIDYIKNKDLNFSYTLNGTCNSNMEFTKNGLKDIYDFLKKLKEAGVNSITVAMPAMIEVIRNSGLGFKIKTSTLCGINTANKALAYKEKEVTRIVVDEDITRDFRRLKGITDAFGEGVEIIVNDTCMSDCAYKTFHFNCIAHCGIEENDVAQNYYLNRCNIQRIHNLKNYMHLNWIRPEDLHYYEEVGIHYFKIQGRQFVKSGEPIKVAEAYMSGKFDGDLLNMCNLFVKYNSFSPVIDNRKLDGYLRRFVENPDACIHDCSRCNYCETWAKKCIDYNKYEKMGQEAVQYFNNTDRFTDMENEVFNYNEVDQFDFV